MTHIDACTCVYRGHREHSQAPVLPKPHITEQHINPVANGAVVEHIHPMAKDPVLEFKVTEYLAQLRGRLNDLERQESDFAKFPLLMELLNLLERWKLKLEDANPVDLKSDSVDSDIEMADASRPDSEGYCEPEGEPGDSLDANEMVWE